MEYKKIEKLVYNNNLIQRSNYVKKSDYILALDKLLITNLSKCIEKNVPLEINEVEFSNVYKIYLKLLKKNYEIDENFITNLAKLATKQLDYLGIIHEITE